jgi:hypothetical protein
MRRLPLPFPFRLPFPILPVRHCTISPRRDFTDKCLNKDPCHLNLLAAGILWRMNSNDPRQSRVKIRIIGRANVPSLQWFRFVSRNIE